MAVSLVRRKPDGRIRELLEHALARYDAGHITAIAIVSLGNEEMTTAYIGDAVPLVYAAERLKLELLSDGD